MLSLMQALCKHFFINLLGSEHNNIISGYFRAIKKNLFVIQ